MIPRGLPFLVSRCQTAQRSLITFLVLSQLSTRMQRQGEGEELVEVVNADLQGASGVRRLVGFAAVRFQLLERAKVEAGVAEVGH